MFPLLRCRSVKTLFLMLNYLNGRLVAAECPGVAAKDFLLVLIGIATF